MMDKNIPHSVGKSYDASVPNIIPYYRAIQAEAIKLVKAAGINPQLWIDTGCGTGTLAAEAVKLFPETVFVLADPSPDMLDEAKKKQAPHGKRCVRDFVLCATQDIMPELNGSADVVTAVMCHHYLNRDGRAAANRRCYDLLRKGGIYITFENVRPFTGEGTETGKKYWINYQLEHGRSPQEAAGHLERFDKNYFPITVEEHLALLRGCRFRTVELLWYAYMQAGFYCIK